jgi:hypothetical protein
MTEHATRGRGEPGTAANASATEAMGRSVAQPCANQGGGSSASTYQTRVRVLGRYRAAANASATRDSPDVSGVTAGRDRHHLPPAADLTAGLSHRGSVVRIHGVAPE